MVGKLNVMSEEMLQGYLLLPCIVCKHQLSFLLFFFLKKKNFLKKNFKKKFQKKKKKIIRSNETSINGVKEG